ncbi:MAG: metallophosphoesterase [Aeromicrobium sp.]|uniref:metallophosphoesterase family protein n=1 Tax=Aeromicrobium sp. TaxID=1871063 RepID=UPI003C43F922
MVQIGSGHRMTTGASRGSRSRRRSRRRLAIVTIAVSVLLGTVLVLAFVVQPTFLTSSEDKPPIQTSPTQQQTTPAPSPTSPPATSESPEAVVDEPEARLAIAGDTGTRTSAQMATAASMASEAQRRGAPYDALVLLGDMIYPDGDADLTRASVTQPFAQTLQDAVLIPALGNHDIKSDEEDEVMRALGRDTAWFVERVGPATVISLDSNRVTDPAQLAWLRKVLAEEKKAGTWIIPVMHHPAYSSGKHGSTKSVQKYWVPLFESAGVRLVLAGHDHNYERTTPQNNVTYVVSGGGAKLRKVGRSDFTAMSTSTLHYTDLVAYQDRLEGRAVAHDGTVFDTFTIDR